jgi:phosphonatase-like hydrolase
MDIELCVFDVAGTTISDDGAVADVLSKTLGERGIRVGRDDAAAVMGLAKPAALRALLAPHRPEGPTAEEVDELHRRFVALMLEHYRTSPGVHPLPGVAEAIARLRSFGVKIALDTGFDRALLDAALQRVGWRTRRDLDATVASDEVERGRPAPDMIRRAMLLCGASSAARVAKIGDTLADVEEGRAAGCGLVVGVTTGTATERELRSAGADLVLPGAAELADLLLADVARDTERTPRAHLW